ncbi:hypothetical protein C7212DRAFT_346319 [Tuber magnatum]|uniref:Uncharacterized protein n=1 Tax=Tuber magnatum TaxID=42249 RepID=A0A317SKJ3_9PEZI|nr:hypothetical protein C7212DRAFT_346319 [Tuber magnatum]
MYFSTHIIRTTLLILSSSILNLPIQANGYWTRVSLRIEGHNDIFPPEMPSLFDDTVFTAGHIVTAHEDKSGSHMCDGTNNGAHTTPGATITSTIDDAVTKWEGRWSKKFQEYFITSISEQQAGRDYFWAMFVNYKPVDKGGCQSKVAADDQVLVGLGKAGARALQASASPSRVVAGEEVEFTVVDGANGAPVEGARVQATWLTTGVDGKTKTRLYREPGEHKFRAWKNGDIRSTEFTVTVTEEMSSQAVGDAGFRGCNQ